MKESPSLLPEDFDSHAAKAVMTFWLTRTGGPSGKTQGGSRDAVISGKNMDGFVELVRRVAAHCGLPMESVHTRRRDVVLPGYFRPTKNWDVLVIHHGRLLAAFEFKSQVGSFGNNFNNRSEEVIGVAADLWAANRQNAYQLYGFSHQSPTFASEPGAPLLNPIIQDDPRPPFLAWLMLLEDCPKSRTPVRVDEPHYGVFPEFKGASYAKRYQILCERLMNRQLYGAAALVLSESGEGGKSGAYTTLSTATGLKSLFTAFAAKVLSTMAEFDAGG